MAHALTHLHDLSPEEALREIKAERSRRSWIALFLFVLSAGAIVTSFYFSYRNVPAPASPANNAPGMLDPYH
jgi:hypothetical protein